MSLGVHSAGWQNQASGTCQQRGHPHWSGVPPAGTFPRKSRRAQARQPGRGCPPGSGGTRGAPTSPAYSEGTAGLPGSSPGGSSAERRRRDQTIRRPPEPDWPDPDPLPLSGAAEQRSGVAFCTRRHSHRHPPGCHFPPKGHLQECANDPKPIQGVPAWLGGKSVDACGSRSPQQPHAGSPQIPLGCTEDGSRSWDSSSVGTPW